MAIFTALIASLPFAGSLSIFGLGPVLSGAIVNLGKGLLYSALGQVLAGRQSAPKIKAAEVQAVINQDVNPRIRGYGRNLLGGQRAFWEATGGSLYQIILCHHGPVHDVVSFRVAGDDVTLNGSNITNEVDGKVKILSHDGSGDGGDYAEVTAAFPAWTADHDLPGQATIFARMDKPAPERFNAIFPQGSQTAIQMIADLSEVYDPRTETTVFSDNSGLCIRDYITHPDGMAISSDFVDDTIFSAFANKCDVDIDRAGGGTSKAYRLAGTYALNDPPKTVLAEMLKTCDGQVYLTPEGKVGICGGGWFEPDVTISDEDIFEINLNFGRDPFSDFNILKGVFVSPDHGYTNQECAAWRDEDRLLTEPEKQEMHEAEMVPDHAQMQRLLQSQVALRLPEISGTIVTNLVGMKARFPDGANFPIIRVQSEVMGLDDTFLVTSHDYSVEDGRCTIGIASIYDAWDWSADDEKDPPPPFADLAIAPDDPPVPAGLTLAQIVSDAGGVNVVQIAASVTDAGRPDLQVAMEIKENGASVWNSMNVTIGGQRGVSGVLEDGVAYDVRAFFIGAGADPGDYPTDSLTVVTNPVEPDAPTDVSATLDGSDVDLEWTNGVAGFYRTRIYRADSTDFEDASVIATEAGAPGDMRTFTDAPGTGTWSYWFATINASSVESDPPTGPETVTV